MNIRKSKKFTSVELAAVMLVVVVFAIAQTIWCFRPLPVMGGDSSGYLERGAIIAEGKLFAGDFEPFMFSYFLYNLFVACVMSSGVSLVAIPIIQTIVSAAAVVATSRLGGRLAGGLAGFVAALVYAANAELAHWNGFVLTDSFYISLVPITILAWVRVFERFTTWRIGAAVVSLIAITFLRPHGYLWPMLSVLGFVIHRRSLRFFQIAGISILGAVVLTILMIQIPQTRAYSNVQKPAKLLTNGQIVWGDEHSRIAMPPWEPKGEDEVDQAIGYIKENPFSVGKLMAMRVWTEVIHVRRFYSRAHNFVILVTVVPLQVLTLVGLVMARRSTLAVWCAIVIVSHHGVTALMQANWDGRWLDYVMPVNAILASIPIAAGLRWIAKTYLEPVVDSSH